MPTPGQIKNLPLLPTKTGTHPAWKRHQRPDGSEAYDLDGKGPLESTIIKKIIAEVNRVHKGKTLDEKIHHFRALLEDHRKGATSATSVRHPAVAQEKAPTDYLAKFQEQTKNLPKKFSDFVPDEVRQAGDDLLLSGATTGYNVDSYGVGEVGGYSSHLREGNNKVVYHQYTQYISHGLELLSRLQTSGLNVPYELSTIATSVAWDSSWGEDPDIQLEPGNDPDHPIGRSVQFALAFKPADKRQADKLADFFEKQAKHGEENAIEHSWFVQDIRSSFKEKVDEYQLNILNIKPIGKFELLILKKDKQLPGFQTVRLWLNKELSGFIKSLAVFIRGFSGLPLALGRAHKSMPIVALKRHGDTFIPLFKAAKKVTLGVLMKAAPAEKKSHGYWTSFDEKPAVRHRLADLLDERKIPWKVGDGNHAMLALLNEDRRQAGLPAFNMHDAEFLPLEDLKKREASEKPEATPRAEEQRQIKNKIRELLEFEGQGWEPGAKTGDLLGKLNKYREEKGFGPFYRDDIKQFIKNAAARAKAKPEVNIGVGAMPKKSEERTVVAPLPKTDWDAWIDLDQGQAGRVRQAMISGLKRQGVDVQEGWALQRLFAKWNKERQAQGLAAQGMKEIINLFNKPATGAAVKLGSDYLDEAGAEKEMEGHPNVAGLHLRESGERIAAQGIKEALQRRNRMLNRNAAPAPASAMLRLLNELRADEGKKPLRPIDFLPAVHGKTHWDFESGGPGSSTSMDVHRRQVKEHEQRDEAYAYQQKVQAEASELAGRKRMEDWQGRRYHVGPGAGMTSRDVEVEQKQHEAMAQRDRAMAHRRNVVREARNMEADIDRRMTPRSAERAAWQDRSVMARQQADAEARARAERVRERVGREAHEEEWFRRHGSDFTTPRGQRISELPLLPSHKNPRVRRHQRVDKREGGQRVLPKMWVDSEKLHFPVRGEKPKKFETEEAGQRMLPVVPRKPVTPWMGIGIRPGAKKEEDAAPNYRQRLVNELENIFHVQTYFHDKTETLRRLLDEKRAEREVPPLEEKGGQAILPGRAPRETPPKGKLMSAWGGTLEHETDEYGRRWLKKPLSLREGQKQAKEKVEEEKKAASGKARGELQRLFVEKFKRFHPDATDGNMIFDVGNYGAVTLADLAQQDLGNLDSGVRRNVLAVVKKYVDAPTHDAMGHPLPEPTLEQPKIEEKKEPKPTTAPETKETSIKRKLGQILNRRGIAWRESDKARDLLARLNEVRKKEGKYTYNTDHVQRDIDRHGVADLVEPKKIAPESKAKTVPPGQSERAGGEVPKFGVAMKVKREGPATRGTLESEARKLGIERPNLLTAENLLREIEKRRPRTARGGRSKVVSKLPKIRPEWMQEQLPGIGPEPIRVSRERQKAKDELEHEDPTSPITPRKGDHANKGCKVTLKSGREAYWKPASGERDDLRDGIPSGSYYRREIAASEIAEIVGMEKLVPATKARDFNGDGALMDYWDGDLDDLRHRMDLIPNMARSDLQAGAAFDYIIGQEDRHGNNAKVNDDGTRWCLLDNGLTLGTRFGTWVSILGHYAQEEDLDITADVKAAWSGKWKQIENVLKDHQIEETAIRMAKDRYDELLAADKWTDLSKEAWNCINFKN